MPYSCGTIFLFSAYQNLRVTVGDAREKINASSRNPGCGTFYGPPPVDKAEAHVMCLEGAMDGQYITVQKLSPMARRGRLAKCVHHIHLLETSFISNLPTHVVAIHDVEVILAPAGNGI